MSTTTPVWTKFTKTVDGKEVKFRIQQWPSDKFDEVYKLIFDYFANEEPIHKASQITKSEDAFNEYKLAVSSLIKELNYQVDACCVDDDSGDLKVVAGSIMVLERKGELGFDEEAFAQMTQSREMKTFLNLSMLMANAYKVSKKFNLDLYYDDRGIIVHPDYRGLGIAGELFKARVVTCRERGVPMTGAWMTSLGSQKAASKLGWETVCELNYKDLENEAGVSFDGAPPSCKLMVIKV